MSCNVALDHILVTAAPEEMTARVFWEAEWAHIGGVLTPLMYGTVYLYAETSDSPGVCTQESLDGHDSSNQGHEASCRGSHFIDRKASQMDQFVLLRAVQDLTPFIVFDEATEAMETLLTMFDHKFAAQ